jgi:hypothetical protein
VALFPKCHINRVIVQLLFVLISVTEFHNNFH